MTRKQAIAAITNEIALSKNGSVGGTYAVRYYVENSISWKTFDEACKRGRRLWEARQQELAHG